MSFYVNVYHVDLAYGGSEEGGWYYQTGELVKVMGFATKRTAERARAKAQRVCDAWNEGLPEISSVCSRGRHAVWIDREPGANYPAERPYYS